MVSYCYCMMMSNIFHNTFQAVIFIDRFITQPRQYHRLLILRWQYCQGQRCCHETHLAERGFGKINWVFKACTFRLLYLKHSGFWSASSCSVRFFLLQADNSSTWILLLLLNRWRQQGFIRRKRHVLIAGISLFQMTLWQANSNSRGALFKACWQTMFLA